MASNMNRVIMQANLTKDPECRQVGASSLCKLNLACNREFKEEKEVCFVEAYVWGGLTKVVEQYVVKGMSVLIEGRLKLDSWTSKEGEDKYKHVIVVEQLTMLPSGRRNDTNQNA